MEKSMSPDILSTLRFQFGVSMHVASLPNAHSF